MLQSMLYTVYSVKAFVKHAVKLANTFRTLVLFVKHIVLGLMDASQSDL